MLGKLHNECAFYPQKSVAREGMPGIVLDIELPLTEAILDYAKRNICKERWRQMYFSTEED